MIQGHDGNQFLTEHILSLKTSLTKWGEEPNDTSNSLEQIKDISVDLGMMKTIVTSISLFKIFLL